MRTILLTCLVAGLVLAFGAALSEESVQTVTVKLPLGDPEAGKRAFVELSCVACHRVAGQPGLPEPVSGSQGPSLGPLQALQSPSQIATSIVSPSHQIVEDLRVARDGDLSPMGDYTASMTVRQLVDLIAFVRSGSEPTERPAEEKP
jgi:cytochrome c